MSPSKGNLIELRFNNGITFEAFVESWSDEKSVLVLPKGGEIVVIQKTLQDVLLFKIINLKPNNWQNDKLLEFNKLKQEPKHELNLQRMAELKDELNMIERQEIKEKLTAQKLSEPKAFSYGYPSNIQVGGTTQYTGKEVRPKNNEFGAAMQELFDKKNC